MPPNESRTLIAQGAAENFSDICTARCTTEDTVIQVVTFAQHHERALWRAFKLALDVDLIELTPASKLLRNLAYQARREVYVDLDAA